MHFAVITFLSFTLLLTALALAREVRLRRALQRLLRALLARFYPSETARETKLPADVDAPTTLLAGQLPLLLAVGRDCPSGPGPGPPNRASRAGSKTRLSSADVSGIQCRTSVISSAKRTYHPELLHSLQRVDSIFQ